MIVLAVALPLLAAFLLPLVQRLPLVRELFGPVILGLVAGLALSLWPEVGSLPQTIALGEFRPPLGILFYVDRLSLTFVLAIAALTLLLWPWGGGADRVKEQSLTLLVAAGSAGLALSGDLFNIYVFYELVAVATYGLVASRHTGAAFAAAIRYLIISALGSVLALIGIAIIYHKTGSLNLAHLAALAPQHLHDPAGIGAFLMLLIGFGVKAELFPVNAWAPEVYASTSNRVSALLAGLVSKLAVLVIVRILILVFPLEEARSAMLILGVLGVVSGELAAYRARDLNRMLAWSSIGQLGIVFIAFSLPGEVGILAGLAVALHHLVVKPALFLLATRWGGGIDGLVGAARKSPIAGALFVLFALSLLGVPPLPGFWTKFLTVSGLLQAGGGLTTLAVFAILITTVVEAGYLFRVVHRLYANDQSKVPPHDAWPLGLASLLGILLLAVSLSPGYATEALERTANQAADTGAYVQNVFPPKRTEL